MSKQIRSMGDMALLSAMEKCDVGDSFLIPVTDKAHKVALQVTITRYKRRLDTNFITRTVEGGLRVWRV